MTLLYCLTSSPCVIALSFISTNILCHVRDELYLPLRTSLKNKWQPLCLVAIHTFVFLQNMPCLYPLLDKLPAFIKVIEYAEEADIKGEKSVHCHQDMLQERHIGYQCVLKYLGKTKFKFDYHMPVKICIHYTLSSPVTLKPALSSGNCRCHLHP